MKSEVFLGKTDSDIFVQIREGSGLLGNYSIFRQKEDEALYYGYINSYRPGIGIPRLLICEVVKQLQLYSGRFDFPITHKVKLSNPRSRDTLSHIYEEFAYIPFGADENGDLLFYRSYKGR